MSCRVVTVVGYRAMTSSAVLGAATGTGLALLVAMTIVVYRYYSSRRWGKEWNYKGTWTAGPATYYYRTNRPTAYVTHQKVCSGTPFYLWYYKHNHRRAERDAHANCEAAGTAFDWNSCWRT